MATLEYFLLAESVSIDQLTNRISLNHVVEEVYGSETPVGLPQICIVSSWIATDGGSAALPLTIRVHRLGDLPAIDYQMTLEPTPGARRRRAVIHLIGPSFSQFGDYRFELLRDGVHCANHVVSIVRLDAPKQADQPQPEL